MFVCVCDFLPYSYFQDSYFAHHRLNKLRDVRLRVNELRGDNYHGLLEAMLGKGELLQPSETRPNAPCRSWLGVLSSLSARKLLFTTLHKLVPDA